MECESAPLFDPDDEAQQALLAWLEAFREAYRPVHGRVCVAVCTFGIITNIVHIAVLSRPNMRISAVNCILTAVALCDFVVCASYLVFILHFVIHHDKSCAPTYTPGWLRFLRTHMVLSIALHTASLWLAVAMTFMRCMTLRIARPTSSWQRPRLAWRVSFIVTCLVAVCSLPSLFLHDIQVDAKKVWRPDESCQDLPANYVYPLYTLVQSAWSVADDCRAFRANIWLIGIVFKVVPCLLLVVFSLHLVWRLRAADDKRKALLGRTAAGPRLSAIIATTGSARPAQLTLSHNLASTASSSGPPTDRTTKMLLAVVTVFLVTELPQGVVSVLCALYPNDAYQFVYYSLGDVLDLLSLLNASVNFILYALMSSRYRATIWQMFTGPCAERRRRTTTDGARKLQLTQQQPLLSNGNRSTSQHHPL